MTVIEALNWSTQVLENRHVENPRLTAELLLALSMGLRREGLYIRLHSQVEEREMKSFEKLIERRVSGEPLQYIAGHQEFWSLDLEVDPHVLIPRPETEILVEQTLSILSTRRFTKPPRLLELGTGSGAIAISLAKEVENLLIVATDISGEALILAGKNAVRAEVQRKITFVHGDLFSPFRKPEKNGGFDLILSNPPYITRSEIGRLAKEVQKEPRIALDGGEDGMEFYRRIISQSPFYLRERGWLLLEMGQGQGPMVSALINEKGAFSKPEIIPDLAGIERVVKAQKR